MAGTLLYLSVDDVIADLASIKNSPLASSSQKQSSNSTHPEVRSTTEFADSPLLRLGRSLLPSSLGDDDGSAKDRSAKDNSAELKVASESIASRRLTQREALAQSELYLTTARHISQMEGMLQAESALDTSQSNSSKIERMHRRVADLQARVDVQLRALGEVHATVLQ